MKKFYEAPEMEYIRITTVDILGDSREGLISETIVSDDDWGDDLLD